MGNVHTYQKTKRGVEDVGVGTSRVLHTSAEFLIGGAYAGKARWSSSTYGVTAGDRARRARGSDAAGGSA